MSPKLKALPLAVAQLIAAGAFSGLTAAPALAQMGATPIERITVTGTNIRRTDSETPSEVQVITREQMIQQGYTTVSQVLRDLTANSQGTLTQAFTRAFATGGSAVSLRGLLPGATLVLIDGYRMTGYPLADDGQRNFVDISSIPFVAVDRIEVLLDGASAIYGSDAIAGVVNVILKKDWKGFTGMATGGTTTKGGGTTWDAQLMQGFGDVGAGLGGWLAGEFRSQEAIYLSQRQGERWNVMDYSSWNGNDLRPGARSVQVTNPVIGGAPYLQSSASGANLSLPANNVFLNSNCDLARRDASQCANDNTWGQIQPRTQNVNLIGNVSGRFATDWSYSITGSYFDSLASFNTTPSRIPFGTYGGTTTGGPNQLPQVNVLAVPVYTVPASYPGNTFGAPAFVRATLPDLAQRNTNIETGTSRLVAQATGSAWGWDVNTAAGWTNARSVAKIHGYVNFSELYKQLNDPVHPFLLTGGNSAEQQGAIYGEQKNVSWSSLSFAQVSGSRDLMQLEGGPLTIAIGAGDVYRVLNNPDFGAQQDGFITQPGGPTYAVGSQNNANAYVELAAPVLKTLEVDAALRYDHYNVPNANTWNPKLGVKWTPIQQLALRGTAGTGFRAPWIAEAGNAGALFQLTSSRDPLLCPDSLPNGRPNPVSPNNVTGPVNYCSFNLAFLQSSNPNLEPEKSTNYTAGFVVEPIRGWSTTFDWYYIKLKNQIVTSAGLAGFDPFASANVVRGIPQIVTFGDGHAGLSPAGIVAYSKSPFVNANQTTTDGFDLSSAYTWTLPDTSKLLTSATWNHINSYDLTISGTKYKLVGTHGPAVNGGDTGTPADRAQATIQWAKGPFTATATINYIGRFNVLDPSGGNTDCQTALFDNNASGARWTKTGVAPSYCNVASFTYVNFNFQYAANKNWTLMASILNAFNAKPPFDFETYGAPGSNYPDNQNLFLPYNPSMHQTGAVGPFWSLGFIYHLDPTPEKVAPPPAPVPVVQPAPAPAPVPPPPPPPPPPAPQVQRITLDSKALFDFDKADLKPEGKAAIDSQIVGKIAQVQKLEVVLVTGHTDRLGSEAYNQKLSERRANTVRDYLVSKGVDKAKIETIGMGEKQPVVQCSQKDRKALIECLAPNRRVEVQVKGETKK